MKNKLLFGIIGVFIALSSRAQYNIFDLTDGSQIVYNLSDVVNYTYTDSLIKIKLKDRVDTLNLSDIKNSRYDLNITDVLNLTSDKNSQLSLFPNPAKTEIKVRYSLSENAKVHLRVVDIKGNTVQVLTHEEAKTKGPQEHQFQLSKNLKEGMYFCILEYNGKLVSKSFIIKF
jgi:hypothetical protein